SESPELDLADETPGFADFADQIVRISLDLHAGGPASATLVIAAQTQDNAPGTFAKTFELKTDPEKPDAPFKLKAEVTRAALLAAGLKPETVRSAVLTHAGDGAVTIAGLSYGLEPYHFPRVGADDAKETKDSSAETRRQRTRPYMVVDLRAPGSSLRFDRLESPYAARYIGAGDWLPMAPMTTTDEAGRSLETPKVLNYDEESKEPIAPDFRFRFLRWRFTNRSERDAEFTLAILTGEKEPFAETTVPLSVPARSRKNVDVPLSQLAEEGADLAHVQALELRAQSAFKVAVDRVSLVLDQAPVAIKGIPNFGLSYRDKRPVLTKIFSAVRNTILLLVAAMLMTWLVALPAGVIAAVRQYKLSDKVLSLFSFVGMAVPGFFLAVVVRLIVQTLNDGDPAWWPGLPTSGRTSPDYDSFTAFGQFVDLVKHALLPVCVLSLGGMAGLQRVMRGTMLETKQQPFITTAR
ncbi:MAG: ABC transporter permease, partial [Lentisphaeria bacterium]|nr:ABC transporter permease [Lentisphaeria bacterium]